MMRFFRTQVEVILKRKIAASLFFCISILFLANAFTPQAPHTHASLISERATTAPGDVFDIGILLKMDPGWHTYWKDPGDSGLATTIQWKLPQGFSADPIRWPKPKVLKSGNLTDYIYENEVLLLVKIHVPQSGLKVGDSVRLQAVVDWLECEESCVPQSANVELSIPIAAQPQNSSSEILSLFEKYRNQIPPDDYSPEPKTSALSQSPSTTLRPLASNVTLWEALFGAFVGGMILNLMPCVLPVIAIKILGFLKQSNENPKQVRRLGLLFSLGVMVSLWVLAIVVISFQAAGESVGWGFQFHDVRFILAMALVVVVVAMNFFGVFEFELDTRALNQAGQLASKQGNAGAFLNGVLATALATPCTAPFLAPALGFAFSQPAGIILLIFTLMGAGLCFPYIILAWQPALLKWLPKPGAWMVRFKQAMGFPMLATAFWLIWLIGSGYGNQALAYTLGWLLLSAFLLWLVSVISGRMIGILIALAVMSVIGFWKVAPIVSESEVQANSSDHSMVQWKSFSKKTLEESLKTDQMIFIDFTAKWCLTCQVNKKSSIEIPSVSDRFRELKVIPLLADWTRNDPEITEMLKSFGRSGVPLYVIYPLDRNRSPIVLSEILTPQMVLSALEEAKK
jgi:thiol:disulfide interchange protein